jgi:PAS domain S-box-containing protein
MDTSPLQAERLLLLEANRAGRSADQALSDSLREVEDLYENAPCGYQSLDGSAWFLRVNRTECDWLGYTRDELIGKLRFPDLMTPESAARFLDRFPIVKATGAAHNLELELVRKDRTTLRVLVNTTVQYDPDGSFNRTRCVLTDITARTAAEQAHNQAQARLERASRALRTLSRGNEVVVHSTSEDELFRDMCRVIVEANGYRIAWIGTVEHDAAKSVRPVAAAGSWTHSFAAQLALTWSNTATGRGTTGRAIRSGEPQVSQDFLADPAMAPWHGLARDHQIASAATFPLNDASGDFAILAICAAEPNAFDADAMKLLRELAADLAYGVNALRARRRTTELEQRWRISLEATIGALARTLEMRDPYTTGHQQRVARLAMAIARALALPEHDVRGIYLAGIIHDVGKINVPSEILSKPGKLSALEFELIKCHAEAGYAIVKDVAFPWPIAEMLRQHHERLDGSGYPRGIKGDAILPGASILAVADVVEAMTSRRPYRAALGVDAALAEIEASKGRCFDPEVVAACVALYRERGFNLDALPPEP